MDNLLNENSISTVSHHCQLLHTEALQRITSIGQKYPTQFKSVMSIHSDLKAKVAEGVKVNESLSRNAINKSKLAKQNIPASKPSITLKMNFGSFAN